MYQPCVKWAGLDEASELNGVGSSKVWCWILTAERQTAVIRTKSTSVAEEIKYKICRRCPTMDITMPSNDSIGPNDLYASSLQDTLKYGILISLVQGLGLGFTYGFGMCSYNISYGCPNTTLDKIKEAAKIAQVHAFISSLVNGYDTQVGKVVYPLIEAQKLRYL
ncbi:hypothetical protein Tco_0700426 [Tanacetum coccineum]